uniref:Uncharacterized protein n=1 Tax=Arundo donax TaxID=35708 RepID=A0A0A9H8K9_ARUDO
MSFSYFLWGET